MNNETRIKAPSIGGWLMCVALGLLISPLIVSYTLIDTITALTRQGVWHALVTKGAETYNPVLAYLCVFEVVWNILLLFGTILTITLFLKKDRRFPAAYIVLLVLPIVVTMVELQILSNSSVGAQLLNKDTGTSLLRSIITAVIWVTYILNSKRVDNTFILTTKLWFQKPASHVADENMNATLLR